MTTDEMKVSPNAEQTSTAAIVAIYLYTVTWSFGWFSIPYLIRPETSPTCIRPLNMSISLLLHWAFHFGCSKMLSLFAATNRWGALLFSVRWAWFMFFPHAVEKIVLLMPRSSATMWSGTTRRSLEALDKLFGRPWYTVRKVAHATKDEIRTQIASSSSTMNALETGESMPRWRPHSRFCCCDRHLVCKRVPTW